MTLSGHDKICHAYGVDDVGRLKALAAWMREEGATELAIGDVRIVLGSKPPTVVVPVRLSAKDADEARVLSEEERVARVEQDAEAEHTRYWQRVTRSSGAPIPPFRKRSA